MIHVTWKFDFTTRIADTCIPDAQVKTAACTWESFSESLKLWCINGLIKNLGKIFLVLFSAWSASDYLVLDKWRKPVLKRRVAEICTSSMLSFKTMLLWGMSFDAWIVKLQILTLICKRNFCCESTIEHIIFSHID